MSLSSAPELSVCRLRISSRDVHGSRLWCWKKLEVQRKALQARRRRFYGTIRSTKWCGSLRTASRVIAIGLSLLALLGRGPSFIAWVYCGCLARTQPGQTKNNTVCLRLRLQRRFSMTFDRNTDTDFERAKLHALHHRFPTWPYRGKVSGYCGIYTVNQEDFHPVVGATTIPGFIVANGFSGHGFKLAPAVGSLVAQLLTDDSISYDTRVPASFLGVDREPLRLASKSVLA